MHLIRNLKKLSSRNYMILSVIWTIVTLYLSLISASKIQKLNVIDIIGIDKLAHLCFYAVFTFLWCSALRDKINIFWKVIFFSISFGILMEILQFYLFIGRAFELADILANILGCFLGSFIFYKFFK
jgi:VanZ family protein